MQESGILQHPGTRGYGSDGAFLAEAKYMDIAYRQYPHPCTVSSRRRNLVRHQVKTTLAGTETASATNSAAHRETSPLPSGGLELTFNLFRDTTVFQWVKEL